MTPSQNRIVRSRRRPDVTLNMRAASDFHLTAHGIRINVFFTISGTSRGSESIMAAMTLDTSQRPRRYLFIVLSAIGLASVAN